MITGGCWTCVKGEELLRRVWSRYEGQVQLPDGAISVLSEPDHHIGVRLIFYLHYVHQRHSWREHHNVHHCHWWEISTLCASTLIVEDNNTIRINATPRKEHHNVQFMCMHARHSWEVITLDASTRLPGDNIRMCISATAERTTEHMHHQSSPFLADNNISYQLRPHLGANITKLQRTSCLSSQNSLCVF